MKLNKKNSERKRMSGLQMLGLFILSLFWATNVQAQSAVSVGTQVTSESALESGKAYVLQSTASGTPYIEDVGTYYNVPTSQNAATTACVYYIISNGDGTWKFKNMETEKFWGKPVASSATPATSGFIPSDESAAGNWTLNFNTNGTLNPSCNGFYINRSSGKLHAWTSGIVCKIFEVGEAQEAITPTASDIYTLNNTNSYRGALIYNPGQSTKWVWSSGKSGTFNATSANSQWILMPTGTNGQYYLYNVGAKKFAIPVTGGTYPGYSWALSSDAATLTLNQQSDGTYKLKTVSGNLCVSVSNNYEGPIINYDDIGAQFTITKVGDASSEVTTQVTNAVNKLIHKTTPLSAVPSEDGWYAIRIKTNANYPDYFVFTPEEEINYNGTSYALNFYNAAKVRPAIDNATYYFRIAKDGNGYDWQMPNGRYLYNNVNKFPVSTEAATAITIDHSNSGFRFYHNNGSSTRYGVPYYLSSTYFIGETSSSGNAYYDIYPISLANAGLTAWQVLSDDAPASAQITCSRTDVSGLTSVYKNGYFFLPSSVTPEASDFFLPGGASTTVDATAHTITIAYNPDLAIVKEGVSVEQGWQTAARGKEVMLLRVNAAPFNAPTGVTMNVSLKDGAESNISKLTLYEASSASPEILSTGSGAPTKTVISEATIAGSTATFTIGNFSAGTHYYWIGATITEGAELGAIVDAAVTDITYTYNSKETTLDLTSVGDPSDRGAMVFNVHSYPFLPRDNGSRVYRIPALVTANDGSLVAAADKRYESYTDIGGGHVIDIVVRRSTDGGKTWGEPVIVAKGQGTADNAKCGYGDPSLTKGKDGKLYCLFAAGNTGYFYGLNRICMSTSEDNGVTWTEPVDLFETGRITDHTQYGLFDYFVTSGKGLYTNDGILMYLIPAQCYTDAGKSAHISNSNDYLFYSTDDGATWHIDTTPVYTGGDEAKLEQMADGTLIASVRQAGNRGFNTGTYTKNDDGTVTFNWDTQTTNATLYQPYANNQDIIYYDREKGILFHTMTKGQHANLNLYMSSDNGSNWVHVCQLQPKGARYATMTKLENGDLGILFEDQSLNAAGGYTDYNHYPINFLTIAKEQIEEWIKDVSVEAYDFDANFDKVFIIKNFYPADGNKRYVRSAKYNEANDLIVYRTDNADEAAEMLILEDHQNEGYYYVYDLKSNYYLKASENANSGTAWTYSTTPVNVKLIDNTANHTDWILTDGHIFLIQNSEGGMANAFSGVNGNQVKNWNDANDVGTNWYIYAIDKNTTSDVFVDPTALYYIKNADNGCYFETGTDGNLTRNTQGTAAKYAIVPVKGQDGYFYLFDTENNNFVVSEEATGDGGQWTRSTTTPTAIKITNNITNQYMDRAAWNPSTIIYLLGSKYANRYGGGMSGLVKNYNAQADKGSHWYIERVDNSTPAVVELKGVTENIQSLVESVDEAKTQLQYTATVGNEGYGTVVVPFDADVTGGVEAYTTSTLDGANVVLNSITEITANTPAILKNPGTLVLSAKDETIEYKDNPQYGLLTGVYANTTSKEGTYVLQNQGGEVAFYLVGSEIQPAIRPFRAYLTAPSAAGAKALHFAFGETNGIDSIEIMDTTIIEGVYNLAGQQTGKTLQKGINIIRKTDGTIQKVIMK